MLVGKDLGDIWRNKGARALLMLLPVVLVVLVPMVYAVAISFLPGEVPGVSRKLAALLGDLENHGPRQQWMAAFTTLLCPLLFLCVPIMCSVVAAAQVFVGEKEGGTLETLLLTAIEPRALLQAKVTCCTLLSVAISLLSFVAFGIAVSVADLFMGAPFFLNWNWLISLVLVMPLLALFSVVFVAWELRRVHSYGEALQTMGYLLLPLLLLYLIQFAGVFHITPLLLLLLALALAVLSVVVFNITSRHFQPDRLLGCLREK